MEGDGGGMGRETCPGISERRGEFGRLAEVTRGESGSVTSFIKSGTQVLPLC